jgi:hypothetical protein
MQRIEIIAAIDELNQYLNGYVFTSSIVETLEDLAEKLKNQTI